MKYKPLIQDKMHQFLLKYIGGSCYMKKMSKKLTPLLKYNLIKKPQEKYDKKLKESSD